MTTILSLPNRQGIEVCTVEMQGQNRFSSVKMYDATITASSPDFSGKVITVIEASDLVRFSRELDSMYRALKGSALLYPLDNRFSLMLEAVNSGVIKVEVELRSLDYREHLHMTFETDQTILPSLVNRLSAVTLIE